MPTGIYAGRRRRRRFRRASPRCCVCREAQRRGSCLHVSAVMWSVGLNAARPSNALRRVRSDRVRCSLAESLLPWGLVVWQAGCHLAQLVTSWSPRQRSARSSAIRHMGITAHAPLSTVSTYAYVNLIVAILLGVLFRNEYLTVQIAIGAALVVVAVAGVVRQHWRRRRPRRRVRQSPMILLGARAPAALEAGGAAECVSRLRRSRTTSGRLADALDAVRRGLAQVLDAGGVDRRHVEGGWDQVGGASSRS